MSTRHRCSIFRICVRDRFFFLLASLLLYLGLAPFVKNWIALRLLMTILLSTVFLAAVYAISHTRRQGILASLLALPMLVVSWLSYALKNQELWWASHLFSILFLFVTMVAMLRYVLGAKRVTRDVIYAAVVVYLLIGVTWSVIYSLLEFLVPNSFNLAAPSLLEGTYTFIYYSFVTLTTLGYGDISPLTDQARALVILEAVIGQLYLAVLVARLVGTHISHKNG